MLGAASVYAPTSIGAVAILALTGVNALGLRPGKWTQNVLSVAKLVAFVGLLSLGLFVPHGRIESGLTPFFAPGDKPGGLATALVPVLFAYSGWNAATYVSGEMRDPRRALGRALSLGTSLCIGLYMLINLVYLRAMSLDTLTHTREPAREAAMRLGGAGAAAVLSPLVAICVLSSMQASILVGPRIYHAMSVDGLFFSPAGRLHRTTKAPVVGLVAQAAVALAQLFSGSFDQLLGFATFAMVAFSTLTVAAVVVLRVRRPREARAFRVPGGIALPLLFVAVNVWVLWSVLESGAREARVGLAIVVTGVPAYAAFRRLGKRSKETLE